MSNAKLVAITQPTKETECDTAEQLVAFLARVSNPDNQNNKATASRLVKYLVDNKHWSPLEMVHIVIDVTTTREIARQILRHGSFKFQEFSQRYAEVVNFADTREARLQDSKNRQNSIEIDDDILSMGWAEQQNSVLKASREAYKYALDHNIAKEQARVVLPEGLTISRMYVAGTLRSWIHYCLLRMSKETQKEHRQIAEECWHIICQQFPSIADIFVRDELDDLVEEFAKAMKKKLKQKRDEGWLGWDDRDSFSDEELQRYLRDHVEKGDPVDIANLSAFVFARSKNEN